MTARFEWDFDKDVENQRKHGVGFSLAQQAFADPKRVIGARASEFMSKRIKYSNEPVEGEVVRDFLPPPEQLAVAEVDVKITISLSRRSVEFFKEAAERNNTSYQRMIRHLLDSYSDRYQGDLTRRSGGRSAGSRR